MNDAKVILEDGTEYLIEIGSLNEREARVVQIIGVPNAKKSQPNWEISFDLIETEKSKAPLTSAKDIRMTVVINGTEKHFENMNFEDRIQKCMTYIFRGEKAE